MLELTDHLSVWELAHRWHDQDPNTSNPTELPLPVQDTIRFLYKGLVDCEISVCNANGIELKNLSNALSYGNYLNQNPPSTDEDIEETTSAVVFAPETSESHWDELMLKAKEVDALSPPIEEQEFTDDPDGYETYHYRYGRGHWSMA